MYEILFQYGPVVITTFNMLLAVSFFAGMIFLIRFIQLKKLKLSFISNNFVQFLVYPLLAGRIFYIAEHFGFFRQNPLNIITVWDLKFSQFGIFYAAFAVLYIFTRKENEDFWAWVDAFALAGIAGLIFIHIGHFFNGTDYGAPTELPWGIAFDTFNIPFTKPIHPTQIYSAIISFIILTLSMTKVKKTHLTGVAGNMAIMLYSLSAFGIDFLHGSQSVYLKTNYLIIAGISFIFYIHCTHRKILSDNS